MAGKIKPALCSLYFVHYFIHLPTIIISLITITYLLFDEAALIPAHVFRPFLY